MVQKWVKVKSTTKTGYLKNSPDVNESQNVIQGGHRTIKPKRDTFGFVITTA